MAVKRPKISRKADIDPAHKVVDLPPGWVLVLTNEQMKSYRLDFEPLRAYGRDDLVHHMRDAIWTLRHECASSTLQNYVVAFDAFMRFLSESAVQGVSVICLADINRRVLDLFVGWINVQHVSSPWRKSLGSTWAQSTRSSTFQGIKAFLINRQRNAPGEVCPGLEFPRNPFPHRNRLAAKRESYSVAEHKRIIGALNLDLRRIHAGAGEEPLPPLQVLAVYLLVLASVTGRNLQPLLELRRDSLKAHPMPDRELLTTSKRRGFSTHATSVRKGPASVDTVPSMFAIPASVGDHFRHLCAYTAPTIEEGGALADFVFIWRHTKSANKGQVFLLDASNAFNAIRAFVRRHGLMDDAGHPLALNVARLRPTFADDLYRRTGDVRQVQQALGHANPKTTVQHYVGVAPEAERNHGLVLEAMVAQFTRIHVEGKVLLAADGKIPLEGVKGLLSGGYSTGIARCRNPFRDEDSVCRKFLSCFKCPSMLVFEDDLWRLFSFYYRLLSERPKMTPQHWMKTYGPIIRRIDGDIAPQFPSQAVQAARDRAQKSPHPTWR